MAAQARIDVHHFAPRCLLALFDAAAGSIADWSEFDAEVELEALTRHRAGSLKRAGSGDPLPRI
jgi:hypothetical protein